MGFGRRKASEAGSMSRIGSRALAQGLDTRIPNFCFGLRICKLQRRAPADELCAAFAPLPLLRNEEPGRIVAESVGDGGLDSKDDCQKVAQQDTCHSGSWPPPDE